MNQNRPSIRVLLVEDDESQAVLLVVQMSHLGDDAPEIQHVHSLKEAAPRLSAECFDVILLDLSLPDSFGIETLCSMQILAGQGTPIVVFSGFEDELVRQEALRIGAAEFIVKGKVSPEALAQVLVQAAHQQHH